MPRKAQSADTTIVLTPEEARRQEWEEFQAADTAHQNAEKAKGNLPCPECGMISGYNPVTGIQVRSHLGREVIEGHRDSCSRNVSAKAPPKRNRASDER